MPSNHLILCPPLLLPSIFPSIRVFSKELALHIKWPKYWASASASVLPMTIQDWFPLGLIGLISLQSKGWWVSSKVLVILTVNTQSQEIYTASRFSKLPSWFCCLYCGYAGGKYTLSSLVAQMVKNLLATQETLVWSLGQEDALEKGMVTHSSILVWRILWTDHGVAKSWTQLSNQHFHFHFMWCGSIWDLILPCITSWSINLLLLWGCWQ